MTQPCYHCGEDVPENADFTVKILGESRPMCCPGCEAVARTIIDSGLVSYYQYRTEKAEKADLIPEQLQALINYDNDEIQSEFVRKNIDKYEVTLSLTGVTCAACAWLIEKQINDKFGVKSIRVNTTTHRAILVWDNTQVKLSELLSSIHKLGYKAAPFEADAHEASYHRAMKQYLYRLGVAGLASMQVMMLAIALYFEVFGDLDSEFKQYLRMVSLLFATPVLVYSASPFYLNAWRSLRGRTLGMDVPVSIALIFAYIASVIATFQEKGDVFFESVSMFTFFLLLGRFLEMRARRKAAAASANLLKLVPAMARKADGTQVPVRTLKPGDQIRVLPGEHIPSDGVIIEGRIHVDESMLTGESIPVVKCINDCVYAGSINTDETFLLEVTTEKTESMLSNIVRLQDEAQMSKPKIGQIADIMAKYFVAAILTIAFGTWVYWHQHQPDDAFWIMLSVLVATCPCALSLATPTAITCATSRMSDLGLLLRKAHVIETFCKVNHLIIDKTGTLTKGEIHIDSIETYSTHDETICFSVASALEAHANHPIAKAFKQNGGQKAIVTDIENIIGCGIKGLWQEKICRIGNAKFVLDDENKSVPSSIFLSIDNIHVATFCYSDPIRDESKRFIEQLNALGIKSTLLTGDTLVNAKKVANEINITNLVSDASPIDKLNYLRTLDKKEITLMVGDGINDAPTLSGAHLSIAMGSGTDVAKASADVILLSDKLSKITHARALSMNTRKIIKQNLAWSLAYNLLILPLAVAGYVAPYIAVVGMSASSIIVVTNSLRLLKKDG